MAVVLGHVYCSLKHEHRKGYSWDPAEEADDIEDRKDKEHDCCAILMSGEVYRSRANAEYDLQDAGNPYNLLGERAYHPEVYETENESDE
jgi:hypothetical protein